MNTIEDFKNAPNGATAIHGDGSRAMKIEGAVCGWVAEDRTYYDDKEMVLLGYTLDQPATAQEALELAWELAHPVWEGQTIPEGTRYLKTDASGLTEFIAKFDFQILPHVVSVVRTLERLSWTVPSWVYAPAVLASTSMCPDRKVWVRESGGVWKCSCCRDELHWYELVEVAPLYPPNEGTKYGTTAPKGYTPSSSMGLKNEEAQA